MKIEQMYAGDRIDYMNARRASKPATGGTNYAVIRNPVDERARVAGLSDIDVLREKLDATFAESRALVADLRNQLRSGLTAVDAIPF